MINRDYLYDFTQYWRVLFALGKNNHSALYAETELITHWLLLEISDNDPWEMSGWGSIVDLRE